MEPAFIYYNNLSFNQHKRFTLEFPDGDQLEGVIFPKNKDYYIISMSCYAPNKELEGDTMKFE